MQRRKRPRCELEREGGLEPVERRLAFAAKGVSKQQLQRIAAAAGVQSSMYRLYDSVQREAAPLLYQETLKTDDGQPKTWDLYDPTRLVQHVLNTCTDLAEIYRKKLAEVPAPWHIVIGYDEHVPGDKLKIHNLRKSMVLAFNFLELGEDILRNDCTWFVPVVLRSSELEDVCAGWSQALKLVLRRMLVHELGPAKGGIPFSVHGEACIIYATVSDIISDGDGHKQGLEWIGAGGLKPCLLHSNVWSKRSRMDDASEVLITCHEHDKFVPNDHGSLYESADVIIAARSRFEDGRLTSARFKDLIKVVGLNNTTEGLLADPELRVELPILNCVVFDWLHTCFQEGSHSVEMYEMFNACSLVEPEGFRHRFADYLKTWQFPHHLASKGRGLHRVFDDYREEKMAKRRAIVGQASEQFALYPLLRHYVDVLAPEGVAEAPKASFAAACKVSCVW